MPIPSLLLPALLTAIPLPSQDPARADALELAAVREVVAEALFLPDTLPPGGTDLNLSLAFEHDAPDVDGQEDLLAFPRLQLAQALGDRLGFTADVGLSPQGDRLEAPGASLKLLLRDDGGVRTGLSASLDWYGSFDDRAANEAGLGLGAIRALGPVTLRASTLLASGVSAWTPHAHGGLSAAMALGDRWRVLLEVVGSIARDERLLQVGPTLKAQLGEQTALMFGGLVQVAGATADPVVGVQLTQSL